MPAAPTTPATPEWLAAAAKADVPLETDKIVLRSSAPPARNAAPAEPKKPAPEPSPRLKLTEAPAPTPDEIPKLKADVDRAPYPSRVMLPETIVFAAVGVCWVMAIMKYVPVKFHHLELYVAIPGALALFQFMRFLFRKLSGGYRLTNNNLLRSKNGLFLDPDPIDLTNIAAVQVDRSVQDWILGTGMLRVTFDREGHEPILLGPVGRPGRRAKLIENAVEAARSGQVVATRVAA